MMRKEAFYGSCERSAVKMRDEDVCTVGSESPGRTFARKAAARAPAMPCGLASCQSGTWDESRHAHRDASPTPQIKRIADTDIERRADSSSAGQGELTLAALGATASASLPAMGNSVKKMFDKMFGAKEMRVVMLGLDAAGKTTILYKLHIGEVLSTVPTIGASSTGAWRAKKLSRSLRGISRSAAIG